MRRLPNKNQIISVYAVGVTILFSWATIMLIRDSLFNWILYFNVIEILSLTTYIMSSAFFESILLIAVLLLVGVILPRAWLIDKFVIRGSSIIIAFLGAIIYYNTQTPLGEALINIYKFPVAFGIGYLVLLSAAKYSSLVEKTIELIAERCTIFLYVYMPISLISVVVILFRNLG